MGASDSTAGFSPRRSVALTWGLGGLVAACALSVACGGRAQPRSLPPQTLVPAGSEEEAAPPPPEPIVEESKPETLIVLEEAEPVGATQTLVEAAKAERLRRARATGSSVKLTDKNLDQYAVGELTTSDPDPLPVREITITGEPAAAPTVVPPGATSADPAATGADPTTNEGYWRNLVLDIRLRWRAAHDSIEELEGKVAGLRNQFYATDDPYYRDSQVKPAWDRALEDLETARADIDRYQAELKTVLDDGRRSGALPGWLREGIEHEPPTGEPENTGIDPDQYSIQPPAYTGDDSP